VDAVHEWPAEQQAGEKTDVDPVRLDLGGAGNAGPVAEKTCDEPGGMRHEALRAGGVDSRDRQKPDLPVCPPHDPPPPERGTRVRLVDADYAQPDTGRGVLEKPPDAGVDAADSDRFCRVELLEHQPVYLARDRALAAHHPPRRDDHAALPCVARYPGTDTGLHGRGRAVSRFPLDNGTRKRGAASAGSYLPGGPS
jgi:hypothetical protein